MGARVGAGRESTRPDALYAAGVSLAIEVLDDPVAVESHRDAWDRLAVESGRPYAAPAWVLAWWRHFEAPHARLHVLVALDGQRLVGIAPLCIERVAAGVIRCRFPGSRFGTRIEPLAELESRSEVASAFAEALARGRPRPDLIQFTAIPADSPWPDLLSRWWPGARSAWQHASRVTVAPRVTLPSGGFDAWLASKSRNFRQQMRRGRRQLEAADARFRTTESESELAADLDSFTGLHNERWDPRGGSRALVPGSREALIQIGRELLPTGRFRLATIEVEGEAISSHLFLAAGREASYWLGGFDGRWAAQRPSMVALVEAVEDGMARGEDNLDLGPAAQDYKYRLADSEDRLHTVTLAPPSVRYGLARMHFAPRQVRGALSSRVSPDQRERLERVRDEGWRAAIDSMRRAPAAPSRGRVARSGAASGAAGPAALVTDAHLRAVLAGIRGLGRAGVRVVAAAPDRSAPGLWSRYSAERVAGVDATLGGRALVDAVAAAVERNGSLVVYPGQETSIGGLLRVHHELPDRAILAYPAVEPLSRLRDKRALADLARDSGIAAPSTLIEGTAAELLQRRPAAPCVVKPARGGGPLPTTRPIRTDDELRTVLEALPPDEPLLVQERVRGRLSALGVVVDRDGGLRARFQQAALRTWPQDAGNSSLAISVQPDEVLAERAADMLRNAGYAGMAQLQFVGHPGELALIDVNPRFYGSLPLALACGVNLPAIWHDAVTGRNTSTPSEYPVGVRYRWFGGDLLAAANGSPRLLVERAPQPHTGAVWSSDDPLPGALAGTRTVAGIVGRRLVERR